MYKPIRQPPVEAPCAVRPAAAPWRAAWLRELLGLFAGLVGRLR